MTTFDSTQRTLAADSDYFYCFIKNCVLDTMETIRRFNFDNIIMDTIDGECITLCRMVARRDSCFHKKSE